MHQNQCKLCAQESADLLCRNCLPDAIWSDELATKASAWKILNQHASEGWAQNLLDQMYIDDELLALTQSNSTQDSASTVKDSNGSTLQDGDSVTLIKDLDVKGANFTAKRGLLVKKISLTDDPELIECRVNGTSIYLKTCFLKKA